MPFNWTKFLDNYRIPFVTSGPNINRSQVGIKCPFCGAADPSEHMALPRNGGWWHCRRNRSHGGNTPHRLVQVLANCSSIEAGNIVGDQAPVRDPDANFADQVKALLGDRRGQTTDAADQPLSFPQAFKPLINRGMGKKFWEYLRSRHYTDQQIEHLVRDYDLKYATTGGYAYRLIVPVYTPSGLMSWTGRTINGREELRYKSHSVFDYRNETPPPITNIHDLLLNEDTLATDAGDVLVVAEGPLDAMRIDYFGYPQVRATCFFSKSVSRRQVAKLLNLAPHYNRKWVLLDEDAQLDVLSVQSQLVQGGFRVKMMRGGKDAAALPEPQINELISSL